LIQSHEEESMSNEYPIRGVSRRRFITTAGATSLALSAPSILRAQGARR
jgi:hypothetical protein